MEWLSQPKCAYKTVRKKSLWNDENQYQWRNSPDIFRGSLYHYNVSSLKPITFDCHINYWVEVRGIESQQFFKMLSFFNNFWYWENFFTLFHNWLYKCKRHNIKDVDQSWSSWFCRDLQNVAWISWCFLQVLENFVKVSIFVYFWLKRQEESHCIQFLDEFVYVSASEVFIVLVLSHIFSRRSLRPHKEPDILHAFAFLGEIESIISGPLQLMKNLEARIIL